MRIYNLTPLIPELGRSISVDDRFYYSFKVSALIFSNKTSSIYSFAEEEFGAQRRAICEARSVKSIPFSAYFLTKLVAPPLLPLCIE